MEPQGRAAGGILASSFARVCRFLLIGGDGQNRRLVEIVSIGRVTDVMLRRHCGQVRSGVAGCAARFTSIGQKRPFVEMVSVGGAVRSKVCVVCAFRMTTQHTSMCWHSGAARTTAIRSRAPQARENYA